MHHHHSPDTSCPAAWRRLRFPPGWAACWRHWPSPADRPATSYRCSSGRSRWIWVWSWIWGSGLVSLHNTTQHACYCMAKTIRKWTKAKCINLITQCTGDLEKKKDDNNKGTQYYSRTSMGRTQVRKFWVIEISRFGVTYFDSVLNN